MGGGTGVDERGIAPSIGIRDKVLFILYVFKCVFVQGLLVPKKVGRNLTCNYLIRSNAGWRGIEGIIPFAMEIN